jgi:uncharacterized protein (TIGR02186 family)
MVRPAVFFVALATLLWPQQSLAQSDENKSAITINLANDHVDITTGFDGADVVVYGVTATEGDIALLVTGPRRNMVVRRKEPVMGAWINTEWEEFSQVPSFYDYALSRFAMEQDDAALLQKNGIGLDGLNFVPQDGDAGDVMRSREALIRNKQAQGLFPLKARGMQFVREDFFKAEFFLPSNVPTGDYTVSAYLFKRGKLYAQDHATFRVAQVGFSARIYSFAYRDSLSYGLVAVLMALFAGWAAFTFLRRD